MNIDQANAEAVGRMISARPTLTGVATARDVIPGMSDTLLLHAGPPIDQLQAVHHDPSIADDEQGILHTDAKNITTKEKFSFYKVHLEFMLCYKPKARGQGRSNSGFYQADGYEVQVLDSFDNPTYPNGQAASVYKQHVPLVNASRGPGEWQSYDIIFLAPEFGAGGRVVRPAMLTVFHNGVLVQNNVTVQGPTEFIGKPQYEAHGKAPIRLQDHSNPVSFRNIWLRELDLPD